MNILFRFVSWISMVVVFSGFVGCGDDSDGNGPSGRQSSISLSGIRLAQDGRLEVTLSVLVKNGSGEPLAGVDLLVETSRPEDDEVIEGETGITDITGGAIFHIRTDRIGSSDVKVTLVGRDVILGPLTVDFGLDVALYLGRSLLVDPGVRVTGHVVISDADGPLTRVPANVEVDSASVTVVEGDGVTDDQGVLPFELESRDAVSTALFVEVSGLKGSLPAGNIELVGPKISGQVTSPELPAVVTTPRIGMLFIDYVTWRERGVQTPQEIVSAPLVFSDDGTAAYELTLPVRVPEEHLSHSQDVACDVAVYMVVVYDDVGLMPGVMDEGDLLVGLSREIPQVVFVKGVASGVENVEPGYNMMFVIDNDQLSDVESWDEWASSMDMGVPSAEVPEVTIQGSVTCTNASCDGEDWIAAAVVFDLSSEQQDPWSTGAYEILDSMPVTLSNGSSVPFSLDLPDLTSWEHYDDWSGEFIATAQGNGIALMAFRDINGNGLPDIGDGEPLSFPDQPWGLVGPFSWYLHRGFDWGIPWQWPEFHAGYALFVIPLELGITEVHPSEHRLVLDRTVEAGHSGYRFRIIREIDTGYIDIVSGMDLDTGMGGDDVTTNVDLSVVESGDTLVITQFEETMRFVGYDGVDLKVR